MITHSRSQSRGRSAKDSPREANGRTDVVGDVVGDDAGTTRPDLTPPARAVAAAIAGLAPESTTERPTVLVAVDGTPTSEPAARVALALADERRAQVHVLSVVDTRPVPIPPPLDLALAIADGVDGEALHADAKRDLRLALSAMLGRSIDWPVEVALGTPSHAIVSEARRLGATLVVLGLRHHGAIARALNDETTLNVMRTAPCPVLGATPSLTDLPQRVVVGVDFSRASLTAARAAKALVADGGTLLLAYVRPPELYVPDDGERVVHELGVAAAFSWFVAELGAAGPGVKIDPVVLGHAPERSVGDLLLAYAERAAADLIAVGSMRHGRVERWILGSVTSDVARNGSRALLAVPPRDPGTP